MTASELEVGEATELKRLKRVCAEKDLQTCQACLAIQALIKQKMSEDPNLGQDGACKLVVAELQEEMRDMFNHDDEPRTVSNTEPEEESCSTSIKRNGTDGEISDDGKEEVSEKDS